MIYKLVYSSKENIKFDQKIIESLHIKSAANNKKRNVTGIILYINGDIIQLIEGDKDIVTDLFENKISKDIRHKDIKILFSGFESDRSFPQHYMGYKNMEYKNYSNYLKENNYLHEVSPHIFFNRENSLDLLKDIINYTNES